MTTTFEQIISSSLFDPYRKTFQPEDILFQQGQTATSFFIVITGRVWLLQDTEVGEFVFGKVEPGEFLGEKSMLSSNERQRLFSAQAIEPVTAIEMTWEDLSVVHLKNPAVIFEFLRRVVHLATKRLDRANYLVRMLRGTNSDERIRNCIVYLSQSVGVKQPEGTLIPELKTALNYYLNVEPNEQEAILGNLRNQGILKEAKGKYYLLKPQMF